MPACPGCGAENQPGDRFCISCGHPLPSAPDEQKPPSPKPAISNVDLLEAGIVCPDCDTYNEPTQRKCINCGNEFLGVTGLFRSMDAGSPPPDQPQPQLQSPRPPTPQAVPQPIRSRPSVSSSTSSSARLHLLRGFSRAEEFFPIDTPRLTIGRLGATIVIPEDPFLAPVHLVLLLDQGRLLVEDPGTLNGVFLRIRDQVELRQGAEIIVGSQRIMILGLGGPTTDLRTPPSKDTWAYGGPIPRQLFLALRLLHNDPQTRARTGTVILRAGPIVSIGQRDCSINFPNDPRLALRHVDLHLHPASVISIDIGSAGVFARQHSPTVLHHGDEFIIGEELFRVEI